MGKSKKSTPKVEPAPVAVAVTEQTKTANKKGKRDAEEAIEKIVRTKKQKAQNNGVVVAKKITENKTQKKKKQGSSSSDPDDSDSEDEMDTKPAVPAMVKAPSQTKKAETESESDSDDDESESDQDTKAAASAVKAQPQGKKAENESESESEDDDDSDSYKIPAMNPKENSELGEDSEDEQPSDASSDGEDSQDEQPSKASKKKDGDVKMVDASNPGKGPIQVSDKKAPKTPAKPQSQDSGSKTLYVGNLPYSAKQEDVENLFKDVGKIEEVRFASDQDGRFKGFAHVEFATAEDAKKALELQPLDLSGRTLRLDFAGERGSYTPHSKENNSLQKGGRAEEKSLFIRGFDKSLGEDEIRNALQEHFGSCGEITRVSIPKDYESGAVKGIAYMDFKDGDGFNSALELNGSELGGFELQVEQAKPRGDSRSDGGDRSGGRSGRGGRFGGRRGRGGGDWSGDRGRGRDSGGRFGGRRDRGGFSSGRRGRGGDRGRGTPNKFGVGSGRGKKTTFGDDE